MIAKSNCANGIFDYTEIDGKLRNM